MIAAFDLASATGWAVTRPPYRCMPTPIELAAGAVPPVREHGHIVIKNNQRQPFGKFLLDYEIWFRKFFDQYPDLEGIIYEMPFSTMSQFSSRLLLSLSSVVEQLAYRRNIPILGRHRPNDVKKHATGKGNAKKHHMVSAALAVGWEPKTEDEADALWILDYGIAKLPTSMKGIGNDISPTSAANGRSESTRRRALV